MEAQKAVGNRQDQEQELLFSSHVHSIPGCPPVCEEVEERTSFCLVFENVDHPDNFIPYLQKPGRRINSREKDDNDNLQCRGHGLSFFNSRAKIEAKFSRRFKDRENLRKEYGDTIIEGVLRKENGKMSEINSQGHFTFWQFRDVSFKETFKVIGKIP